MLINTNNTALPASQDMGAHYMAVHQHGPGAMSGKQHKPPREQEPWQEVGQALHGKKGKAFPLMDPMLACSRAA